MGTWRVGEGGDSWIRYARIAAGVRVTADSLQPAGFTPDDNIVTAVQWTDVGTGPDEFIPEGGARVWARVADGQGNIVLVDGNPNTSTGDRFQIPGQSQEGRIFIFDLGASFPAERIVLYPNPADSTAFLRAYEIRVSDGRSFGTDERPLYETLARIESSSETRTEVQFANRLVRYIRLETLVPNPFDIAEVEVFGRGFVPRAQYVSDFIDFSDPQNFGHLNLRATRVSTNASGGEDETVQAVLRVRSGTDDTPISYYRIDLETGSETEIAGSDYENLIERERTTRYDAQNWSAWSNPVTIDSTGSYTLDLDFLPMPRRFFQFQLSFTGTATEVIRIDALEFTHSLPLAAATRAEVAVEDDPFPFDGVASTETGRAATFVYAVAADLGGGAGFDGLRIATPNAAQLQSVTVGEGREPVVLDSLVADARGMSLYFPGRRMTAENNAPLFVTFTATPLLYSTLFRSWLLDTGGSLPQLVAPGDASPQVGTNSLLVFGSLTEPLGRFDLSSDVVTPNGDGSNDRLEVLYDLIFLVEPVRVEVTVHDLSGRLVHRLFRGEQAAGTYSAAWAEASDVPPGNYIVRLGVETQTATFKRLRTVAIAY